MNKNIIVLGVIVLIIIIGGVSWYMNSASAPAAPAADQTQATTTAGTSSAAPMISATPLMQSTGEAFAQYQYYSKAHAVYPTLGADTVKAMGAFSFKKEDLGGGVVRITLTNNAEGYQGQSVVVGSGQSVYFIERSSGDDSDAEDSVTTDDFLVAVDAAGMILK